MGTSSDKDGAIRVELGLDGGQVVEFRADPQEWERICGALEGETERWLRFTDADGDQYVIPSMKVGYARALEKNKGKGLGFGGE